MATGATAAGSADLGELPSLADLFRLHPTLPRLALSIRQPWASLVLSGKKTVENRSWTTHHRGPVLIHASKARPEVFQDELPFLRSVGVAVDWENAEFIIGSILGVVDIVDVVPPGRKVGPWHEPDCFGFILRSPRPLPAVSCKGWLRLWPVNP